MLRLNLRCMDQLLQGPPCADVVEHGGAGILRYLKVFTLEVTSVARVVWCH